MIHEHDIREKIAALVRRDISVVDFARWVMANSWNVHQDSPGAVDIVESVHLLLAERDDYSLDDAAFLREVSALLNHVDTSVVIQPDLSVGNGQPSLPRRSSSKSAWLDLGVVSVPA